MPKHRVRNTMDTNAWKRHGEIHFHTRAKRWPSRLLDWFSDHPLTEVALVTAFGAAVIILTILTGLAILT